MPARTKRSIARKPFLIALSLALIALILYCTILRNYLPILSTAPIQIGSPFLERTDQIYYAAFLADGKTVAVPIADRGIIALVDARTGRFLRALRTPHPTVDGLAATPIGGQLICIQRNGHLVFLDPANATTPVLAEMDLSHSPPNVHPQVDLTFAVTPDGKTVAINAEGRILLIDVTTHTITREVTLVAGSLDFSPDGTRLIGRLGGGRNLPGKTLLYEFPSCKLLRTIDHTSIDVAGVHFSKDSHTLAIHIGGSLKDGPNPDSWYLYDAATGEHHETVRTPSMNPHSPLPSLPGTKPLLPEFARSFRTPYLTYSLLSPDGTRQVTPGNGYGLAITNPTLSYHPSINVVFFPPADGKPFNTEVTWFRFMRTTGGDAYWHGSSGVQKLVQWHRHAPDPSYAEIRHQLRPDILDRYLDGVLPP